MSKARFVTIKHIDVDSGEYRVRAEEIRGHRVDHFKVTFTGVGWTYILGGLMMYFYSIVPNCSRIFRGI